MFSDNGAGLRETYFQGEIWNDDGMMYFFKKIAAELQILDCIVLFSSIQ